jgi:BirA family biotin operon repressor/biotin-[acetyl-CoA-carboxylase] ligase
MSEAILLILDEVDSTNTYGKNNFGQLPDGSLVAAVTQTAGRGRLGRKWLTPPGTALTASAVLKNVEQPFHAGCILALAALEMLRETLPEQTKMFFKWPNDIYIGCCKLAGILSEGVISQGKVAGVVCGIGININQNRQMLDEIPNPATSAAFVSGKTFDINLLYKKLFAAVTRHYADYQRDPAATVALWKKENRLVGQFFEVITPDGIPHAGYFRYISDDGAMFMETEGKLYRFDCGDVKIDTGTIDFDAL